MSPDSLATFSVAETPDAAEARARLLIDQGCSGIDLGGAGSTPHADRVDTETEWRRLAEAVERIVDLGVDLSIDTWNAEVMRRALDAGATVMNAADGLQSNDMISLAAERNVTVVLPFLSGPDPKAMSIVEGDPLDVILPWFEERIADLENKGVASAQLILDPGTGFGAANWEWEDRARYQHAVYSQLDRLRTFGLPIYVALPWKFDGGRLDLLDIVLRARIDYGRTHLPDYIRQRESELGLT